MLIRSKQFTLILALTWGVWAQGTPSETCGMPSSVRGADCDKNSVKGFLENSTVRCKVLDIHCSPEKDFKFKAELEVEKWLSGTGNKKIEAQFSEKLAMGKGLCADLTLQRRGGKWIVIEVANPTTSKGALPSCKLP